MNKKSTVIVRIGLILAALTLGCRTLGELDFIGSTTAMPTPISWPQSTFTPANKTIQVPLKQPVAIETHHLTAMTRRLDKLEIFINGQPIRTEAASSQATFPSELATIQILRPDQAETVSLVGLSSSPPTCRDLFTVGNSPLLNSSESPFPSAEWNICYVWIGHVPGTYDLSLVATDSNGEQSQVIAQRIEVIGTLP